MLIPDLRKPPHRTKVVADQRCGQPACTKILKRNSWGYPPPGGGLLCHSRCLYARRTTKVITDVPAVPTVTSPPRLPTTTATRTTRCNRCRQRLVPGTEIVMLGPNRWNHVLCPDSEWG